MAGNEINRKDFLTKVFGFGAVVVAGAALTQGCTESLFGSNTYAVSASKCNGCKKCIPACGHNAISMSGNVATISESNCVGCGKCVGFCSQKAISLS